MTLDTLTRQAISHTRHCLTGCAIGEIAGMVIAELFSWTNAAQTVLSIVLAFFFGYLLTYRGARGKGMNNNSAVKMALSTDTISISSMETIDNAFIWIVPNAINARLDDFLFWWSLLLSLAVAFVVTVPVNRFVISRSGHHHHH